MTSEIGPNQSECSTPRAAVGRLSLYLRELEALLRNGQETVSSNQLGLALKITDAQVRKDLAYFGQFGYPGVGYRVAELRTALRTVLGTNRTWQTALVGVGNLGRALLNYGGFQDRGFEISALFDKNVELIGTQVRGMEIHDLNQIGEIARQKKLELAILSVPAEAAEEVARTIVNAGIVGILNFAPVQLKLPDEINVVSVDLGLQLEQLAFQVNQRNLAVRNGTVQTSSTAP